MPVFASLLVQVISVMNIVQKHYQLNFGYSWWSEVKTQAYADCPIFVSHESAEMGKTTATKAAFTLTGEVLHIT